MIQIGQTKHTATVIRLDSRFADDDGLPCRRIGTRAQTAANDASIGLWVRGRRVLSAMAFDSYCLPNATFYRMACLSRSKAHQGLRVTVIEREP